VRKGGRKVNGMAASDPKNFAEKKKGKSHQTLRRDRGDKGRKCHPYRQGWDDGKMYFGGSASVKRSPKGDQEQPFWTRLAKA